MFKKANKFCLLALMVLLFSCQSYANYHYVRAGADGNNTGLNWTDAWDDLPSSLTRGDTYYIADGTYGRYTFDDALDGVKYIYIKKAIVTDHGTETGWLNTYGDGQAIFLVPSLGIGEYGWRFIRPRYIIDGQVGGGPGSWDSGHGIKIHGPSDGDLSNTSSPQLIRLGNTDNPTDNPDYLEIHHVEITTWPFCAATPQTCTESPVVCGGNLVQAGITAKTYLDMEECQGGNNFTFDSCYFHHAGIGMYFMACQNVTIEKCYFTNIYPWAWNTQGGGSRTITAYRGDNFIIRNNWFHNATNGTGCIVFYCSSSDQYDYCIFHNIKIYGNIFDIDTSWPAGNHLGTGQGGHILLGAPHSIQPSGVIGFKVYNNTFCNSLSNPAYGGLGSFSFSPFGAGDLDIVEDANAYNNLFYLGYSSDFRPGGDGGLPGTYFLNWYYKTAYDTDMQYNWFDSTYVYTWASGWYNYDAALATLEGNGQNGSGNPFTSYTTGDFTLTAATNDGIDLTSEDANYATDMYGFTRGSDGIWDRGAIEYYTTQPVPDKVVYSSTTQPHDGYFSGYWAWGKKEVLLGGNMATYHKLHCVWPAYWTPTANATNYIVKMKIFDNVNEIDIGGVGSELPVVAVVDVNYWYLPDINAGNYLYYQIDANNLTGPNSMYIDVNDTARSWTKLVGYISDWPLGSSPGYDTNGPTGEPNIPDTNNILNNSMPTLVWGIHYGMNYNLYIGIDPNSLDFVDNLPFEWDIAYWTGKLKFNTTYYWRVDANYPDPNCVVIGPVQVFKTLKTKRGSIDIGKKHRKFNVHEVNNTGL